MDAKQRQWIRRAELALIALLLVTRSRWPHWFTAMFTFTPAMKASAILWLIFTVYWAIASKDQAPTKSSESAASRLLHLALLNLALLLVLLRIPGLMQRFVPDSNWVIAIGLAIQAFSTALAIWARRHLGSNWSGEVRIAAEHQLVRTGPYRFVRHPIYTAMAGMCLGCALVSGEIHGIAGVAIVLAIYWRKIRLEERVLGETFGDAHQEYRRATWAFVPGLW